MKGTTHIKIYTDVDDKGKYHYLRLCWAQTPRFSHGVSIATPVYVDQNNPQEAEERIQKFAEDVEKYLQILLSWTREEEAAKYLLPNTEHKIPIRATIDES